MKTSKLFKTLAIMLSMVMSLSMVSCGDDEPDDDGDVTPDIPSVVDDNYIQGYYVVDLGDAYYQFYDVTLTYVDVDGKEVTKQLTSNVDFLGAKLLYTDANKDITYKLEVSVKSELPEYDASDSVVYDFKMYTAQATFFKFIDTFNPKSEAGAYMITSPFGSGGLKIKGSQVAEYLERYPTHTLRTSSVTL
jgi:hypothetical protein